MNAHTDCSDDEKLTTATDVGNHLSLIIPAEVLAKNAPNNIGIFPDLLRRDDNFLYPRRMLGDNTYPEVDGSLTKFSLTGSSSKFRTFGSFSWTQTVVYS